MSLLLSLSFFVLLFFVGQVTFLCKKVILPLFSGGLAKTDPGPKSALVEVACNKQYQTSFAGKCSKLKRRRNSETLLWFSWVGVT